MPVRQSKNQVMVLKDKPWTLPLHELFF